MNDKGIKEENAKLKEKITMMENILVEREEYLNGIILKLREEVLQLRNELNGKIERENEIVFSRNKIEKEFNEAIIKLGEMKKKYEDAKKDISVIIKDNKRMAIIKNKYLSLVKNLNEENDKNEYLKQELKEKCEYIEELKEDIMQYEYKKKENEEIIRTLHEQNQKLINEIKNIYERDDKIITNYKQATSRFSLKEKK